jgi:hypothetical protein
MLSGSVPQAKFSHKQNADLTKTSAATMSMNVMCERCGRQLKLSKSEMTALILKFESYCSPLGSQSKVLNLQGSEQGGRRETSNSGGKPAGPKQHK